MKRRSRRSRRMRRIKRTKKSSVNTKPFNYNFFIIVLVVTFAAVGIVYGLLKLRSTTSQETVSIYYFDPVLMSLKPEIRPITITDNKEIIKFVLEELAIGPKNVPLVPSVPPNLIKAATVSGTNVAVEMSEQYENLELDEEMICRSALAYTLTNLDFVDSVTINVNGEEIKKPNGNPLGQIKLSDIVTEPNMTHLGERFETLTLYFANAEQTKLVAEKRTVLVKPNELVAKYIVEELINGPNLSDSVQTVPRETVLRDISISDGICYVDLSKEFITRLPETTSEILTVYSIVNSLTEQSDIKNVQFYIEGERLEKFKSINDFSNLFEEKSIPFEESE